MYTSDTELIERYCKELKLPTVKDSLEDMIMDAGTQQWDLRHFLCNILQREVEQRIENRKYQRIRKAGFPQMKYLQDELYDCAEQSAALDKRMQSIRNLIAENKEEEKPKEFFLPFF